jgi:hypothetical protein
MTRPETPEQAHHNPADTGTGAPGRKPDTRPDTPGDTTTAPAGAEAGTQTGAGAVRVARGPVGRRKRAVVLARVTAMLTPALLVPLAALGVSVLVSVPGVAHADPATGDPAPQGDISLDQLFTNGRNFLMGILGGLVVLCWTIAAIRYAAAQDRPEEVEKAKNSFRNGVYGFVLAAVTPFLVAALKGICGVH